MKEKVLLSNGKKAGWIVFTVLSISAMKEGSREKEDTSLPPDAAREVRGSEQRENAKKLNKKLNATTEI